MCTRVKIILIVKNKYHSKITIVKTRGVKGKKKKRTSFEPDLNQRPVEHFYHYSPPLYQLSYRRMAERKPLIAQ